MLHGKCNSETYPPILILLVRSMRQKYIWSKHCWSNNIKAKKKYLAQKNFSKIIILTENFFGPNFFLLKIFLDPKILLDPRSILDPQIFGAYIFSDPKHFLIQIFSTKNNFWPKMFWTKNFFGPKIFLEKNFGSKEVLVQKNFWSKKFSV